VDFVIAETFGFFGEAMIALEEINKVGLPAVVTLSLHQSTATKEGVDIISALKQLKQAGALVVGLNCARGPDTMLSVLGQIRQEIEGPIACLPVAYETNDEHPTFQSLIKDQTKPYLELESHLCTRFEMAEFARKCVELGVNYIGGCCGSSPYHIRAMAEAIGREPVLSKYSPDVSKHFCYGTHQSLKKVNVDYKDKM